jgi:hypothetical protein
MIRTYEFIPGSVAALLYVRQPMTNGSSVATVFLSYEKGVVVGRHDKPLADWGWPIEVQAQINKHFGTVFALEHKTWKSKGPSPRAQYVDNLLPWQITVDEPDPPNVST